MSLSQSEFREFYLMFMTSDYWLFKHLKKGFGHCVLLINDGYNWIWINPLVSRPTVEILNLAPNVKITEVESFKDLAKLRLVMAQPGLSCMPRLTCVSKAKDFLGLRGCWSITPWQFYKWLRKLKIPNYDLHNVVLVEEVL